MAIEHHLEVYDLQETVEQERGTYCALMGEVITRFEQGKQILYYTWTPLWLNAVLKNGGDVVWLGVPFPKDQSNQQKAAIVDGKNLGFRVNQMRILGCSKIYGC